LKVSVIGFLQRLNNVIPQGVILNVNLLNRKSTSYLIINYKSIKKFAKSSFMSYFCVLLFFWYWPFMAYISFRFYLFKKIKHL